MPCFHNREAGYTGYNSKPDVQFPRTAYRIDPSFAEQGIKRNQYSNNAEGGVDDP